MVFSTNGMRPSEKKVVYLQAMPNLTTKTELQEFLGLVTYLSPFINNISAQAEPIRSLLKKEVPFQWDDDHQIFFSTTSKHWSVKKPASSITTHRHQHT